MLSLWQVLVAGLGILALGAVAYALWRRQASIAAARRPRAWLRLGLLAAVLSTLLLVVAGVGVAYGRAYRVVHPARSLPERTPESVGIVDYQAVSFPSVDGLTLRGWYVPPRNGAVVVFAHGLGDNRDRWLDDAALLAARGYGALLFDLRNSGESDGQVSTLGLREAGDVQGAVDFVLAWPGVDAGRIGLCGHSMGGAAAILAGARIPQVSAVVAQSAYTSLEDNMADSFARFTGLPPMPFAPLVIFFGEREAGADIAQVRPVDEIASLSPRPILLVHGALDKLVPVSNARALYAAAREPKEIYIVDDAGHWGLAQADPAEYQRRLIEFLDRYLLRKGR